jgi:hypothetical protein
MPRLSATLPRASKNESSPRVGIACAEVSSVLVGAKSLGLVTNGCEG